MLDLVLPRRVFYPEQRFKVVPLHVLLEI
jgi:hypothetical protein